MDNRTIRNYNENEDLNSVIELYKFHNPFFERRKEFFQYILCSPAVHKDGIFVSLFDDTVDGFLIVSINEDRGILVGEIIELFAICVISILELIQTAESYCLERGADIIYLRINIDSREYSILDKWVKYESSAIMAKPLSVYNILESILDIDILYELYTDRTILFVIDEEAIKVCVSSNSFNLTYSNIETNISDVFVAMTSKTFFGIIFGPINPYRAYITRKITIHGVPNSFKILKLLRCIKINVYGRIMLSDSV